MVTLFSKTAHHVPKWFLVDATNKTLGRLTTEILTILTGKNLSYFTPGSNQGNYVIVVNSTKIFISGKKENQKLYYSNSQRPGSLKTQNFKQLIQNFPTRIIQKAVWGMLPKNILGRNLLQRLYIYPTEIINIFNTPTYTNLKLLSL
jgi:large subunit ribosomal protein L13